MIPFYMDRMQYIEGEILKAQRDPNSRNTEEEIQFLVKQKEEAQKGYDKEKHEVSEAAQELYDIWN